MASLEKAIPNMRMIGLKKKYLFIYNQRVEQAVLYSETI